MRTETIMTGKKSKSNKVVRAQQLIDEIHKLQRERIANALNRGEVMNHCCNPCMNDIMQDRDQQLAEKNEQDEFIRRMNYKMNVFATDINFKLYISTFHLGNDNVQKFSVDRLTFMKIDVALTDQLNIEYIPFEIALRPYPGFRELLSEKVDSDGTIIRQYVMTFSVMAFNPVYKILYGKHKDEGYEIMQNHKVLTVQRISKFGWLVMELKRNYCYDYLETLCELEFSFIHTYSKEDYNNRHNLNHTAYKKVDNHYRNKYREILQCCEHPGKHEQRRYRLELSHIFQSDIARHKDKIIDIFKIHAKNLRDDIADNVYATDDHRVLGKIYGLRTIRDAISEVVGGKYNKSVI